MTLFLFTIILEFITDWQPDFDGQRGASGASLLAVIFYLGLAVRVSLPANMLICARLCTLKSRIKNELKESEACGPDSSPEIAA